MNKIKWYRQTFLRLKRSGRRFPNRMSDDKNVKKTRDVIGPELRVIVYPIRVKFDHFTH